MRAVFCIGTYSCQFDAQVGSLDHAFLTQSLKGRGVGGKKWHNTDEPGVLDGNEEFRAAAQVGTTAVPDTFLDGTPCRSSDHDPLKVGFTLPALTGAVPSYEMKRDPCQYHLRR